MLRCILLSCCMVAMLTILGCEANDSETTDGGSMRAMETAATRTLVTIA